MERLFLVVLVYYTVLFIVIKWPNHTITQKNKPYMTRWPLLGGDGLRRAPWPLSLSKRNVFIHWIQADDGRAHHNHPWPAKSLILWGQYLEWRRDDFWRLTAQVLKPGRVNRIDGTVFHRIDLLTSSCVTLFWTEKKHGNGWGFRIREGKFIPASSLEGNARDVVDELRS